MRNFVIGLVIFILLAVGVWTVVSRINNRKPSSQPNTGQTVKQEKFADKATKVRLTTDGAIVGAERHQSIRITIDPASRTIEILNGYKGEVAVAQSIVNDSEAFKRFLQALDSYGYSKENPKAPKDEQGTCPLESL